MMLPGENLVAHLNDQVVPLLIEALTGKIRIGGALLQDGVSSNHFAGNQVLPNREVFKRALGLCAPELIGGNIDLAETVGFFANVWHHILLLAGTLAGIWGLVFPIYLS